jgi:hypothetical protein
LKGKVQNYYAHITSNPFLIRATGGVGIGIGTSSPSHLLHVGGNTAIAGNLVVGSTTPGTRLRVVGLPGTSSYPYARYNPSTGDFFYDVSSRRYKSNIRSLLDDYDKVLSLQPKKYTDLASGETEIRYIAEELDEAGLGNLVIYDDEGRPNGLKYDRIAIYLVEILKGQQKRIEASEEKTALLNAAVGELRAMARAEKE